MSTNLQDAFAMQKPAKSGKRRRFRRAVTTSLGVGAMTTMTMATMTLTGSPAALAATNETTVTHTPVTWQIAGGANCSQLGAGDVITGEGTLTNRIVSHTGRNGLTTVKWYQIANGSAVDQNGHRYRWVYKNHEDIVNSLANPLPYARHDDR